jgi:23S rRNA pseudouridine2605 synthase
MPEKSHRDKPGERIAKAIARAGLASRRTAESWIVAGRVAVNGQVISSPALNVAASDRVTVDGQPLPGRVRTRLFRYHKPRGLMTTHADPQGRPTIFSRLPKHLPRLISVGRLDLNSEGLLLLTNDGGLARTPELPATGWQRRYRARAHGRVTKEALDGLRGGITVGGVRYGPIEAALDREREAQGANVWLSVALREGKNREVRRVLEHLGLTVNRLIRVAYGPFELGALESGAVEEVATEDLRKTLGPELIAQAQADFEGPKESAEPRIPAKAGIQKGQAAWHVRPGPPLSRGRAGKVMHPKFADDGQAHATAKPRHRRDRSGGPRPKYPRPKS